MIRADAAAIAEPYYEEVRSELSSLGARIRLVGLLANEDRASQTYSGYAAKGCAKVGMDYEARSVSREDVEAAVLEAGADPEVHGIVVYYPIFGGARDRSIQNLVPMEKDVEGLHIRWTTMLYHDERYLDPEQRKKPILPCTPLGILKALDALGVTHPERGRESAAGLVATVFNRSEVVGRPLAAMLSNNGARVYSFDIHGVVRYEARRTFPCDVDRATALASSDVVITGVPSRSFEKIRGAELKPGAVCVNFSQFENFAPDIEERAAAYLPRVGPITVAMLLRNTLRLYRNFHAPK
ncbi:MAG: bifunctional methylenetetrahydrofolate dehydrogenase/methenyltetrahydrofolate cyclohydrolase [Planctomycetota bacterium]|nr:MAG: bifunctional methylenetetrahydrofolate dehydrogenase/methenyltetrahydrofolate cyclohydrolase [Planctomycetota bacterium]